MGCNMPLSSPLNSLCPLDASSSRMPGICSTSGRMVANTQAPTSARRGRHTICQASKAEALSYRTAGVDIDAGNELVRRIQKMNPSIGGFSGMVPFGASPSLSERAPSRGRDAA